MKRRKGRLIVRCLVGVVAFGLLVFLGLACSVSSPGDVVRGCFVQCAPVAGAHASAFKVITLNLYHGFPRFRNVRSRLDLIAKQLNEVYPDFVLLQEVPWLSDVGWAAEYLSERTKLNFVYLRGNGNLHTIRFEEGLAIFSRYPLSEQRFTELSPRNGLFEHRIALAVTAQTPVGPIQLITTHLAWDRTNTINAGQTASLEAFLAELPPHPSILAGDFNAREDSPQIRKLTQSWVDAFRYVHKHTRSATCCLSPTDLDKPDPGRLFARVDYVFLKDHEAKSWEILDAKPIFDRAFKTKNGYQWASNHIGVLVEANLVE